MPVIFTNEDPVYSQIMQSQTRSKSFQAWTYFYGNILPFPFLCSAFIEGLQFPVDGLTFVVLSDLVWIPKNVPTWYAIDLPGLCTFWGHVRLFCKMVHQSPIFSVQLGGAGTDNGFGLWARLTVDNLAVTNELIGLVEPLTSVEIELFTHTFKYKSLISIDRDVTVVLYGPLSLVNNDNHSAFQFIDRDYLTDMPIFVGLVAQHLEAWYPTPVITLVPSSS